MHIHCIPGDWCSEDIHIQLAQQASFYSSQLCHCSATVQAETRVQKGVEIWKTEANLMSLNRCVLCVQKTADGGA